MIYSDSDKKSFDGWICEHLDQGYSWNDIENLCVNDDEFQDTLEFLIDDQMWPDELDKRQWITYVDYYKKLHPAIQLSANQKIIGIDQGLYNNFKIPSGVTSTWEQYKKALSSSLGLASILDIEKSCQWIMNHLKDDTVSFGPVKGLVTGSVQSGKTANMAGLISMAADCEWNFFIILSGTIDNLRIQTRDRFKKDLKPSEGALWRVIDFSGEDKKFEEEELRLNPIGKKTFAFRYVTVCLKNKKRLESLIKWLYQDEKRTQKLRIVVIDDEADQASINTADITPEEEQERCAINQLIVNLVNGRKYDGSKPDVKFQAMNYIAYTATPYANVLNERPGESLYPKDFICTLPESSEYFGAKLIFGNAERDCEPFPIVKSIIDDDEKAIKKLQKGTSSALPCSLKKAIGWFLCVSSIIRQRPHTKKKNISMLIHTTSVQKQHFFTYDAIVKWLKNKKEVLEYCKSVYSEESGQVTVDDLRKINPQYAFLDDIDENFPEFTTLLPELNCLINDIRNILMDDDKKLSYGSGVHICVDNCRANKEADEGTALRIVYPNDEVLNKLEKDPVFIIIGGNTLSRGLTIEGLVCSYFCRNSNQADTLMQMARWFGYRKGVEILQRIWLTSGLQKKFEALTKIDMDMKDEIELFMERGISPEQFGPRIRNIPEIKSFRITSKKKSQQAEYDDFDFRGDTYETTDFEDGDVLRENIHVTERFINTISAIVEKKQSETAKAFVWRGIESKVIYDSFFSKFSISKYSGLQINLPIFWQWMEKMHSDGKYLKWNVALINGDNHEVPWIINDDISSGKIERTRKRNSNHIDIGSLRSGRDALADVEVEKLSAIEKNILQETMKSGKEITKKRSQLLLDDIPLLLIYCIKRDGGEDKKTRLKMDSLFDIIGFAIIVSGDGIGGNHAKSIRINIPHNDEELE